MGVSHSGAKDRQGPSPNLRPRGVSCGTDYGKGSAEHQPEDAGETDPEKAQTAAKSVRPVRWVLGVSLFFLSVL